MNISLEYRVDLTPRYTHPHPELHRLLHQGLDRYIRHLTDFGKCGALREIPFNTDDPSMPRWNNGFFSGLDAVALHGFIGTLKPPTYFEIGSGNSTKFARHAVRSYGLPSRIISLDPEPRVEIDGICDEVIRQPLEKADTAVFDCLQPGDILFFDGSHVGIMNSDVTVFFLEVLPRLKPGVWVHVHDIFLPWDYPQAWAERYYSEAYMLACWLLGGDRLKVELPVNFVSRELNPKELLGSAVPPDIALLGGSFWFRK
jgi:hypothetical protein